MNFYYVYVLQSRKDNQWYTGFTQDLKHRFKEHREGKCKSTKHRRPLSLIYFEGCRSKKDALARERYLKSGIGKRYIRNRVKNGLRNSNF